MATPQVANEPQLGTFSNTLELHLLFCYKSHTTQFNTIIFVSKQQSRILAPNSQWMPPDNPCLLSCPELQIIKISHDLTRQVKNLGFELNQ